MFPVIAFAMGLMKKGDFSLIAWRGQSSFHSCALVGGRIILLRTNDITRKGIRVPSA